MTGLKERTTYYFAVVIESEAGIVFGEERILTTGPKFSSSFGFTGSGNGEFKHPAGIDIGPSGNVWVADRQNQRVSEFNEVGEFVRQVGEKGSGNGQFVNPDTVDVDESGTVWVVDEGNDRVEWFDEEGKYLGKFGTPGPWEGEFRFLSPTGIASDANGNLWISDSNEHPWPWEFPWDRVQKWIR